MRFRSIMDILAGRPEGQEVPFTIHLEADDSVAGYDGTYYGLVEDVEVEAYEDSVLFELSWEDEDRAPQPGDTCEVDWWCPTMEDPNRRLYATYEYSHEFEEIIKRKKGRNHYRHLMVFRRVVEEDDAGT